jgi:hypothetical protein
VRRLFEIYGTTPVVSSGSDCSRGWPRFNNSNSCWRSEISWDATGSLASFLTEVGSSAILAPNTYRQRGLGMDCNQLSVLRRQLISGGPNVSPPNLLTRQLDVIAGGVPSDLQRWDAFSASIYTA